MSNNMSLFELENKCEWKRWVSRMSPPLWRNLEDLGWTRENLLKKNGLDMFISWKQELYQLYANAD